MAIVAGGSPRTVGAFYDVAYDRSLQPPAVATGNGVSAGTCTANQPPTGTRTEYEEGIDIDQKLLYRGGDQRPAHTDRAHKPHPRSAPHMQTHVSHHLFVSTTIFV